ncbi:MAG: hypothetical protein E7351_01765 [Clostridiales bacterium]|nr:hypothetical protein [Clostridiales bacterium]
MSTPSNVSSIMIYKIIRDFEKTGRTMHLMSELDYFSQQVIDFANSISDDNFWIAQTPEVKEDLLRICDITSSFCELNENKYSNGGEKFAKTKIGQMPYSWLKGAVKTFKEYEEERKKTPPNVSVSIIHYPNGEKQTSAIFWDKGPIIIEEDTLIK